MGKFNTRKDSLFFKIASVVIAFVLFLSSVNYAHAKPENIPQQAQSAFDQKVVSRVDANRAIEHVRYLSEEIGIRPGGMEGEKQGAAYIASVLKDYGYGVEIQEFPVADQYIGTVAFEDGKEWQMGTASKGLLTGEGFVEGEVIWVEGGLSPTDFSEKVSGKIVLMERSEYNAQVQNAINAGAKGVIVYSVIGSRGNLGSAFNPYLYKDVNVPVMGAANIQGVWLKEMLQKGPVNVKLQTKHYTNLKSLNVIAIKPAKNNNPNAPVVIVGSHMDSVVGAPGANDNASGVALMLELARVFKGYNTDKEIRFMAYGSEERGLLGSKYYVEQLSESERKRIIGMFSPDMVATSADNVTHLYSMTVDGKPNTVSDASVAAGARLGNSDILPGRFGSSDHVYFHYAGIPAALFIWLDVPSWDPLVYSIEKVYHTPQDTIQDNVSIERMQSALDIIGAAVFDLVRKDTPSLENSAIRK